MPSPRPEAPAVSREGLVRGIGTAGLAASVVNSTIGAGIFVLPAAVALRIGAAAPLAFLICLATISLVVACFALAGSRVSASGGVYGYVEHVFGRYAGFLAGVRAVALRRPRLLGDRRRARRVGGCPRPGARLRPRAHGAHPPAARRVSPSSTCAACAPASRS